MLMGKEGGGVGKRVYIPPPLHSVSLSDSKRLGVRGFFFFVYSTLRAFVGTLVAGMPKKSRCPGGVSHYQSTDLSQDGLRMYRNLSPLRNSAPRSPRNDAVGNDGWTRVG
jgi:hypothetical protein